MEIEDVLNSNLDELFEKHTILEITNIQNVFQSEINRRRDKLRAIIGEKYRDFVQASDKISDMKALAFDIVQNMSDIDSTDQKEEIDFASSNEISKTTQKYKYRAAVLIKLMFDITQQIWSEIDIENYVIATLLFQLTGNIKTVLEFDTNVQLKSSFPVVYQQWNYILRFPVILKEKIEKQLSSTTLTVEDSSKCLSSLIILENLPSKDLLSKFLSFRLDALKTSFKDSSSARQSVKSVISSGLRIVTDTLLIIYYSFIEELPSKKASLWSDLQNIVGKDCTPVLKLVTYQDYALMYGKEFIPSMVQEFRVTLEPTSSEPLSSNIICKHVSEWLICVKNFIKKEAVSLFSIVTRLKSLQSIKESCQAAPENWNIVMEYLKLPLKLNLWQELYQDLMINRAQGILSDNWDDVYLSFEKEIETMLRNINDPRSKDPSELDLHTFIWKDSNTDVAEKTCTSNEIYKNGLLVKTTGLSSNSAAICEIIDKHIAALMQDLTNICPENYLQNEKPSSLIDYQRNTCYYFIVKIVEYIREMISMNEVTESSCVLLARFLLALVTVSPSLKQCLFLGSTGAKWMETNALLRDERESVWRKWISLTLHPMTATFKSDLEQSVNMSSQIKIIPKWEVIKTEAENEEGEKVVAQIKSPSQASFPLQQFLNRLNLLTSSILPPRLIIDGLVSEAINVILPYYDKCSELSSQQTLYIQFMFDVKYIASLLVPLEDKVLLARCNETVCSFEEKIDPFDLDALSPYITTNVKRYTSKTRVKNKVKSISAGSVTLKNSNI